MRCDLTEIGSVRLQVKAYDIHFFETFKAATRWSNVVVDNVTVKL
jgi:hypothetical protein